MTKTINSLKWVFASTVLRRFMSFLLFLYIVRIFSRAELGVYREFALILTFASVTAIFSFNVFIIVERSKKYFNQGLQFILLSSIVLSVVLFALRSFLAEQYQHHDLYLYIQYGFWLVIPETLKRLVKSTHELDMNFKLLSIAETINVVFYCLLCIILFAIDQKFYYFIIAFYLGNIVELAIISYPLRKNLVKGFFECLKLKYFIPLIQVFKTNFSFLSLSTAPTVLNIIISDAPVLLLGLFYFPSYIGVYFIASQLVTAPISLITHSLSQVLFPALSLTDRVQLPMKVNDYIKHVIYILWIPILVFGILLKYFTHIMIGVHEDLTLINAIIVVLTFKSLFFLIINPLSTIPNVCKKPQYELYWSIGSLLSICTMVYLFHGLDFIYMVYLITFLSIVGMYFFMFIVYKLIKIPMKCFWILTGKGILYSLPLILLLMFGDNSNMWLGMVCLVLFVIVSGYCMYWSEREFYRGLLKRFKASPLSST